MKALFVNGRWYCGGETPGGGECTLAFSSHDALDRHCKRAHHSHMSILEVQG